jgi:hypothetical protein
MRYEIRERCNTIIANDSGINGVIKTDDGIPGLLNDNQLPLAIFLPRQDSGYQREGGSLYRTSVTWEYHVLLSPVGLRLTTINEIEAVTFPDLLAAAFLSRRICNTMTRV